MLGEPPPDLTISAGHRSVPVVQALRRASGGRTRSIHVGFPRVSPANFDLVIATPQYPIPDQPHLLRIPFALTRAATARSDPDDAAMLADLPAPRRLLVVGGPNIYWRIDEARLLAALAGMIAEARNGKGSVVVTTSPRTPPPLRRSIERALASSSGPSLLAAPGERPSYPALLEAADSIRVTADSVAMVSDAIWTGKPIALVPAVESWLGRTAARVTDWLRPGRGLYPQDLRSFWRELASIGLTETLAIPGASGTEILDEVLRRAKAVLTQATVSKGKNGGRGKD